PRGPPPPQAPPAPPPGRTSPAAPPSRPPPRRRLRRSRRLAALAGAPRAPLLTPCHGVPHRCGKAEGARMVSQQDVAGTARAGAAQHPLDPLSTDEITRAVALFRADSRAPPALRFVSGRLHQPPKDRLAPMPPRQPRHAAA